MVIEHPRRGHYLFFLLAKALARSRFALYSATRLHTLQRVVAKVLILFRTQLLVFFFLIAQHGALSHKKEESSEF